MMMMMIMMMTSTKAIDNDAHGAVDDVTNDDYVDGNYDSLL